MYRRFDAEAAKLTELPCAGCNQFYTGVQTLCNHMRRTHGFKKDDYKSTSLACLVAGLSLKDREKFCCNLCSPQKNFSGATFCSTARPCTTKALPPTPTRLLTRVVGCCTTTGS
eukprot:2632220-Amphidinium_carterae.1